MAAVTRGEIWWADLTPPQSESGAGFERPVLVVQDNTFNASRINTVIVVGITSNLELAKARGNVLLPTDTDIGLNRESVVNVSQLVTITKRLLVRKVGMLPSWLLEEVDLGLCLVLALKP